jgi:hypothetical protein
VKGADGFAARLFIDQETHLPLMLTYHGPQVRMVTSTQRRRRPGRRRPGPSGRPDDRGGAGEAAREIEKMRQQPPELVEYSLFFGDWREADGITFPHTVQRATAGTTDEEWTFSRVRVNPKIDAKKFQRQSN